MKNTQKIALIYDHLATEFGGAEKVIQAFTELYPDAPIYTSVHNEHKTAWADTYDIRPSFLQKIPLAKQHHRLSTLCMPLAFESFNLDEFDIIISISSACAKGVITKPHQLHLSYLLTPTRFLFSHIQSYLDAYPILKLPVIKSIAKIISNYFRDWDAIAAQRADLVVSISNRVKQRAKRYYNRTSDAVIYPPVQTPTQEASKKLFPQPFYLCLSRLVPYKRLDLCVEAAERLDLPLIIAGDGPELLRLAQLHQFSYIREPNESITDFVAECFSLYPKPVCFLGTVTEEEKHSLLYHAKALLMPGEEDFGITAMEAAAVGTPAILHAKSGVSELLKEPMCIHLQEETIEELERAIKRLNASEIAKKNLITTAADYSTENFKKRISSYIATSWKNWQNHQ